MANMQPANSAGNDGLWQPGIICSLRRQNTKPKVEPHKSRVTDPRILRLSTCLTYGQFLFCS